MMLVSCVSRSVFHVISLLLIDQFGHNTYQTKADYLSYCMVSSILLVVMLLKEEQIKSTKTRLLNFIFLSL